MSTAHSSSNEFRLPLQIIALWTVFLLGTLFHTQLALMPLFHGLNVLVPHGHNATDIQAIGGILWGMLAFFMVPMVAIIGTTMVQGRGFRVAHFWLTLLYTVLNLAHLGADLMVPPIAWYQIVLMVFLLGVGLLLNLVAYQWVQASRSHRHRLQAES